MNRVATKPRKRKSTSTVKLRTNGKHKIDAASTISAPIGGLGRILRPQALFRWLGPQLASITPTYIEQTMLGAMAGNTTQAWSLFDVMLKSWPELLACYQELIESVIRKKLVYEPYCEEDEKPTPSALEKQKVVATALRRMQPDPTRDDSDLEGTIRDVLDAWFRGMAVSEVIWQTIDDAQVGTITAPKSTFAVDVTNYAYSADGALGIRINKTSDSGIWPYSSTALNPQPNQLAPFSNYPNKFLIAQHKASGGSPLGGALLRPLAWWWCAANFSSDWLLNLAQVFGLPFRWASYDPQASPETLATLDNMLQNMGSNGWARFPTPTEMQFIESKNQGSDHSPQGELLDRADRYARSLILGQTMTGTHGTMGKGGGQAFGKVEQEVKTDRVDAAGKFAVTVINQQLVPSILMLNFGDTDEMPTLKFLEDEVADLTEAQRDKTLADAGLEIGVDYLRKKYDIPEPADGEDVIGGEKPMPDFGNQFGQPDSINTTQQDGVQPGADDSAAPGIGDVKASDQTGHPFRGNQYVSINGVTIKGATLLAPSQVLDVKDELSRHGNLPASLSFSHHIGDWYGITDPHGRNVKISLSGLKQLHSVGMVDPSFKGAIAHEMGHVFQAKHGIPQSIIESSEYKNAAKELSAVASSHKDEAAAEFYVAHNRGLSGVPKPLSAWFDSHNANIRPFPSLLPSEENKRRLMRNAGLQTKLEILNGIEDDAVFSRELLQLTEGMK